MLIGLSSFHPVDSFSECRQSNPRRTAQGDESGTGICTAKPQDNRHPNGHECSHHYLTRRVSLYHDSCTAAKLNQYSVTTRNCKHLIVDAGHIAIESELADKEKIRAVHLKRSQQYSDEDYKQLEALMYDKMSLKLKSAQVRM